MSTTERPDADTDDRTVAEKLAAHEEVWELLAERDVPFSDRAQRALEIIDEGGDG